MGIEFHHPYGPTIIDTGYPEMTPIERLSEEGIESVIARKLLDSFLLSVGRSSARFRCNSHFLNDTRQRTFQPADQGIEGRRVCFFEIRIDADDVAGILCQSMLETSSGGDERVKVFPGEPDRREGSVGTGVGGFRATPDSVKRVEHIFNIPCRKIRSMKPFSVNLN
jgi:hypothetical protein